MIRERHHVAGIALAEVERAVGFARSTEKALDAAGSALLRGSEAGYRELEKVREPQRLAVLRLEALALRLSEGLVAEDTDEAKP